MPSNEHNAEIEAALREVLASKAFAQSERLRSFLEFVVRTNLTEGASGLKESAIGREVFGRAADYDPKTDPIVRVYAQRLRARLAQYYEGEGAGSAIRIQIPVGGYVPTIERQASEAAPAATVEVSAPVPEVSKRRWPAVVAAVAAVLCGLGLWVAATRRTPVSRGYDSIAVLPFVNLTEDASLLYFGDD